MTTKLEALFAEHGNAGAERVLLMAAILLADELFDARTALEREREARLFAEELATESADQARQAAQRRATDIAASQTKPATRKDVA